jgi:hypothetical protein
MTSNHKRPLTLALPRDLVTSLDLTPAEALHLADLLSKLQDALFDYHAHATEVLLDPDLPASHI